MMLRTAKTAQDAEKSRRVRLSAPRDTLFWLENSSPSSTALPFHKA